MDFMQKYKMQQIPGMGNPADAVHIEMQRMQLELQRRDALIEEQQKRIFQLEDEVKRCNKQIQDLVVQLSNYKENKPKTEMNYKPPQSRYWTAEEHERFIEAVKRYGPKDVKAISQFVGTRNPTQVRTHAQKYYLRLERDRKRRDESDNPNSGPIDTNPDAKGMSDDEDDMQSQNGETVISEGSIDGEKGSQTPDDAKKPPRKRTSVDKTARRSSLSDMPQAPPKPQENSAAVVHSTRQQLQAAGPVVSQVKGWNSTEYNLFIEGLLAFPEERDISKKCKLISERFLPKYSAEDIKQCYAILHNYIKKMEEEAQYLNDPSKRPKTEGYGTYTTTAMPPDPARYANYQAQQPQARPSFGYNGYPSPTPTTSPYADPATMGRRSSYPMDSFSLTKAIPANELPQQPAEFPTTVEQQIYTNAAEYPVSTWNAEGAPQPQVVAAPAPATVTTTVDDITQPSTGNNL